MKYSIEPRWFPLLTFVHNSHSTIPNLNPKAKINKEKNTITMIKPSWAGHITLPSMPLLLPVTVTLLKRFHRLFFTMINSGHMDKGSSDSWGNEHPADSLGMTSWCVILEHPENSPPSLPRYQSTSSPTDFGWLRKFHGSSICCRWGSLFSYWWVSRSAGLCGFQQAPQRLPDGPSQDGAYCGCVSMGALQMEPPGVIRLLRQGVWGWGREVVGNMSNREWGDGHIIEVDQSLWTVRIFVIYCFIHLFLIMVW